ncbi:MAG TPA: sulfatase-like hydrolase/transferase [Vicinamibacterales bacterium]|nr:sulfatase-like hydrolase/transferase [Vicinamibacterales bacterium]
MTVLAAACGRFKAPGAPAGDGPIVLISIDTLRADHLPAYGYTKVRTPAIDALAADGIVFERAYSHAPQTLPAHVSLFSGRLPFDTGVRDNAGFVVNPDERLLATMLEERGYATGGIVSAYVLRKETGINKGFGFFDSTMPASSPELGIGQVQRDGAESEAIAERWLDQKRSPSVFLFLHLYEPHKPYTPPPRFSEYLPYDGEIAYSDEIVGRLVRFLKARGLYDRSTIVLLSDHGEGLGDHGEQEHGLFLYDEAIRVPLIIKQPENAGAGRRVRVAVQHVDLVPTLLERVHAPLPAGLRGRSLCPLLDSSGRIPEQAIYSEALYGRYHFGWSELTALTDARYRYIKAPREELYDLVGDPHERTNIAADRAQTRQALRSALDRLVAGSDVRAPAAVAADARERLQALGYVGAQTDVSTASGDTLPDPKDKIAVLEDYRRSADLTGEHRFAEAIELLQKIAAANPGMADVWQNLANVLTRAGRPEEAVEAFKRSAALTPRDISARVAAASTLFRLGKVDDAAQQARLAAKQASTLKDPRARATAHEVLAKIAIARKDDREARREAALAHDADPSMPLPTYIEGLIRYNQGKFADAIPFFREAERQLAGTTMQLTELHYYTADALAQLQRYAEAEEEFKAEIRLFPQELRARAGLAVLYRASRRDTDAERTIAAMLTSTPTPEAYALATRLWKIFGEPTRAEALRSAARRQFQGDPTLKRLDR